MTPRRDTPLAHRLREMIAQDGPVTLARYMELCLADPSYGYYMTRDPLGARGDFTTAPEISQMFGELVGLWCAQVWQDMGAPSPVAVIELGPGRGTLMADAWRAWRVLPALRNAARLHLVETSPVLRACQRATLAQAGLPEPAWHGAIDTLPEGPAVVVANEFFDALPIRAFERRGGGWHERLVGLDPQGELAFGLAAEPERALTRPAPEGAILEWPQVGAAIAKSFSRRFLQNPGALLAIDYGHARPDALGDTFQALEGHRFVDPLEAPGEADLTAHVDFAALATATRRAGARAHGPITQRDFLLALGLEARTQRLMQAAPDPEAIGRARDRLIDPAPTGMGSLFKVLAITAPGLPVPPPFPLTP
jgi:NADH dehydrogenase [ubiquinone] 1 alpha subcomplex assembly factor 7